MNFGERAKRVVADIAEGKDPVERIAEELRVAFEDGAKSVSTLEADLTRARATVDALLRSRYSGPYDVSQAQQVVTDLQRERDKATGKLGWFARVFG